MGMLDDAIREHLELKRRRGADPGEVAREQREALEPRPEARDVAPEDALLDDPDVEDLALSHDADVEAPEELPVDPPGVAAGAAAVEPPGDETAELDMRTVLEEEAVEGPEPATARAPASIDSPGVAPNDEDSLEWEMPGEHDPEGSELEGPEEDVLEETPEFLRETPEHERLWFEQRPPRDFDFDK